MKIEIFRFNSFDENTYIVYDDTKECVIVDPGCYTNEEKEFLTNKISQKELTPKLIVNTHCHADHILGVNFLKNKYNIPFAANSADNYLLSNADKMAAMWGWKVDTPITIDINCTNNTQLTFGNSILKCMHTPGHTPGGQVIYSESDKFMITGDTIFKGTIGRTDLPGGNYDDIMASIRNCILRFDSMYAIFPGHGESTSVGVEAGQNPFIGIED